MNRIKEMMNDECGMMNEDKMLWFLIHHSSFRIHHSSYPVHPLLILSYQVKACA